MKIIHSLLFLLVIFSAGIVKATVYQSESLAETNLPSDQYVGTCSTGYDYFGDPYDSCEPDLANCESSSWSGGSYTGEFSCQLTYTHETSGTHGPTVHYDIHRVPQACPTNQQAFSVDTTVCTPIPQEQDGISYCRSGYTALNGECYPNVTEEQCSNWTGGTYTYSFDQGSGAVACQDIPDETVPENPDSTCSAALFSDGTCQLPSDGTCEEGYAFGQLNGNDVCVWEGGSAPPADTTCNNLIGYIGGQPYCADEQDRCEATGGTYGQVQGQMVCIPPEEDQPDQECQSGYYPGQIDGIFVCMPLEQPEDETPDYEAPPGAEPDPVTGECDPLAPGYQACVGLTQEVADGEGQRLQSEFGLSAEKAIQGHNDSVIDSLGEENPIEGPTDLADEITSLPGFSGGMGGCPSVGGALGPIDFYIDCTDTARLRELLGYAFAFITFLYVFNVATARPPA